MTEKPKRKAKNRPTRNYFHDFILRIVVFLAVAFSCLFFFMFWTASMFSGNELSGDDAKMYIEAHLETELPAHSFEFYANFLRWQGYTADMRFSASPNEIKQWLEYISFCSELQENNASEPDFPLGSGLTSSQWWQPETAKQFTWFEQCGENPWYELFIDQTDINTWIVYLSTGAD